MIDGLKVIKPAKSWIRESNQELPQFYPLFPFNQFKLGDEKIPFFKNAYEKAPAFRKGKVQSWHQDGIQFARMGMTQEAAEYNTKKLQDSPRRFLTFWGPGHDWVPDHNWGGSGMIGLQEVLMQTFNEQMELFRPGKKDVTASEKHRKAWREVFALPIPGGPVDVGFDEYFGTDVPNWPPYCFIENDRTVGIPAEFGAPRLFGRNRASTQGPARELWSLDDILPALASRSAAFIEREAESSRPFLLYLPLTSPHTPLSVNDQWLGESNLSLYADLIATIAGILNTLLPANAEEDSFSLLPLLQGSNEPVRQNAISTSISGLPGLRHGNWKYIAGYGSGGWTPGESDQRIQLYNLAENPGETQNLAGQEPRKVKAMKELLEKLIAEGRSNSGPKQENDVEVIRYP